MKQRYRWIAGGMATLIVVGLGYDMWQRTLDQELWGYRPLFWFLAAWVVLLVLLSRKWTVSDRRWRWLVWSSASGALLSVGFPPLPTAFLLFGAFVPLLLTERAISAARLPLRTVLFFSYNTFVLWNILTTYWVGNTAFVAGIVAIWLNAFFMAAVFTLAAWTTRQMPRVGYLPFITFWIGFEYLHLNWEISWSWLNLGNAFAALPGWIQWYEYTGIFGGTLWILGANVLLLKLYDHYRSGNLRWSIGWRIACWLIVPLVLSVVVRQQYQSDGTLRRVAIIQPNFEPHYEKFRVPRQQQLRVFLQLAQPIISDSTDYLLFPETAFGSVDLLAPRNNAQVRQIQVFLQSYPELQLISGVSAHQIFQPTDTLPPAVRRRERNGKVTLFEAYNAAIQLSADPEEFQFYKKSKLVPGAEFLPYRKLFFWLKPLVDKLDGSLEGFGGQKQRTPLVSDDGKVAAQICYESVFGEYSAGYVRAGAQAIFIMTNDGWWDNTAGHIQHLQFARLRAIESRRAIARSANTGISAFIDPLGNIRQPTKYGVRAAIEDELLFSDQTTFYVRWGDLIARVSIFTLVLLLLNAIARRLMPAKG